MYLHSEPEFDTNETMPRISDSTFLKKKKKRNLNKLIDFIDFLNNGKPLCILTVTWTLLRGISTSA